MQLSANKEKEKLTISVSGRVDSTTAPELESYINEKAKGITELILDVRDMSYISSAGLRVILKTYKTISGKGSFRITNAHENVREIFDMTGFSDTLNIE